jgi:hypothetical protein
MNKDTKDSAIAVIPKDERLASFLTYLTPSHKIFGGRYRLPGGKIKVKENYKSTLKRELIEEYDISLYNIKLHYQKPNVLGGTIYLCSAQKNGNPIPKESSVGNVEWMSTQQIFESNMIPNCKIAVCAYLLDTNLESFKKIKPIMYKDQEFLEILSSQADSLSQKIKQYI